LSAFKVHLLVYVICSRYTKRFTCSFSRERTAQWSFIHHTRRHKQAIQ